MHSGEPVETEEEIFAEVFPPAPPALTPPPTDAELATGEPPLPPELPELDDATARDDDDCPSNPPALEALADVEEDVVRLDVAMDDAGPFPPRPPCPPPELELAADTSAAAYATHGPGAGPPHPKNATAAARTAPATVRPPAAPAMAAKTIGEVPVRRLDGAGGPAQ